MIKQGDETCYWGASSGWMGRGVSETVWWEGVSHAKNRRKSASVRGSSESRDWEAGWNLIPEQNEGPCAWIIEDEELRKDTWAERGVEWR